MIGRSPGLYIYIIDIAEGLIYHISSQMPPESSVVELTLACHSANRLGECIKWSVRDQTLYWTDINAFQLHYIQDIANPLETHQCVTFTDNKALCCFAERANQAGFVCAFADGFAYLSFDEIDNSASPVYIADPESDKKSNRFNDGRCDRQGRFFAGCFNWKGDTSNAGVYRLEKGTVTQIEVVGEVMCSNGIAFSPDYTRVYFADSPQKTVFKFDYDEEDGSWSNKQTFFTLPESEAGMPDGASVDTEGYYWCALYGGAKVIRVHPHSGEIDAIIPIPALCPTMIAFGGTDMKTAFVTSSADGVKEGDKGKYPHDGCLFSFRVDVAGMEEGLFVT